MAGTMDMEKYKEMLSPRSVYNGRYTVLKLGNIELAECYANKAQTKINKETVPRCGTIYNCSVETSADNTGTLKLHKINAFFQKQMEDAIAKGDWPTFEIVEIEQNPKTGEKLTKTYKEVSFDTLDWADWSADSLSGYELAYTFSEAVFS